MYSWGNWGAPHMASGGIAHDQFQVRGAVLAMVRQWGSYLQYAAPWLRADPEIVLAAVKQDPWAWQFADVEQLTANRKFMLEAAEQGRAAALAMVQQHESYLQYAAPWHRADPEVVLAAVRKEGWAWQFAARELLADEGFVQSAAEQGRAATLAMVQQYGFDLRYAAPWHRADRQVVLAAVQQDPLAWQFAAPELLADPGFQLEAAEQGRAATLAAVDWRFNLNRAAPWYRADRQVVLEGAKKGVAGLEYAAADLLADKEVMLEAVKQHGHSLHFAAPHLRADKEFVLAAVQKCSAKKHDWWRKTTDWGRKVFLEDMAIHDPIGYASEELRANRDFVVQALKVGGVPLAFDDLSAELRADEDLKLLATRFGPWHKEAMPELARPSESAIALSGEDAPMVSVTFPSNFSNGLEFQIVQVHLLFSGTTFSFHLDRPNPSLNDLAQMLVENWPPQATALEHDRVFIAIASNQSEDDGAEVEVEESLRPVTPWDCDKPLADFFTASG